MMKTFTLALTLMATQSHALSCVRPDVVRSYNGVAKSESEYVVLLGSFKFPKIQAEEGKSLNVKARFTGKLLTGAGFNEEVTAPVTISFSCAGPWCGRIEPGSEQLSFVQQDGNLLTLQVDPCYGLTFPDPSAEQVKLIEDCAAGLSCEPAAQN